MEMRKFIIELHSDGSMSWVEYEDQKENQVEKIIKAIEQRKVKQQEKIARAASVGNMDMMNDYQIAALEDHLIIRLIKSIKHA